MDMHDTCGQEMLSDIIFKVIKPLGAKNGLRKTKSASKLKVLRSKSYKITFYS